MNVGLVVGAVAGACVTAAASVSALWSLIIAVRHRRRSDRALHMITSATQLLIQDLGRAPTPDEVIERLPSDTRSMKLVANFVVQVVRQDLHFDAGHQVDRVAIRKLRMALMFLPPSDRVRYQREWFAELATLPRGEAIGVAAGLLATAPRTGMALIFRKAWKRRTT